MKFQITHSPSGPYITKAGIRVLLSPASFGRNFADEAAAVAHYQLELHSARIARETASARLRATYEDAIAAGATVDGITYGIRESDLTAWTQALTALDNAAALGVDVTAAPVESVLGPILDITGTPVPTMTVMQFRGVMAQVVQRVGQLRAQYLNA